MEGAPVAGGPAHRGLDGDDRKTDQWTQLTIATELVADHSR